MAQVGLVVQFLLSGWLGSILVGVALSALLPKGAVLSAAVVPHEPDCWRLQNVSPVTVQLIWVKSQSPLDIENIEPTSGLDVVRDPSTGTEPKRAFPTTGEICSFDQASSSTFTFKSTLTSK